jgi:hypothetical protein
MREVKHQRRKNNNITNVQKGENTTWEKQQGE